MREQLSDGNALLARLRKSGPMTCDGILVLEEALIHQPVNQCGEHALRRGERESERVFLPRVARWITGPSPDVHHRLPAMIDTDGRTAGTRRTGPAELRSQRVDHRLERGSADAVNHRERLAPHRSRSGREPPYGAATATFSAGSSAYPT